MIMSFFTLSRRNHQRLQAFKKQKRAIISLYIFITLCVVSACSFVLANDRPLILSYKGELYCPLFHNYNETEFGGVFVGSTDYHDPIIASHIEAHGWMLWPLIPYSYDTIDRSEQNPFPSPPSSKHWLGTDDNGKDIVACVLYGFGLSVAFGTILTVISSAIGICVGAILGYYGGWLDLAGQRFMEIWGGLPVTYLLIILAGIMESSIFVLLGTMLLFNWMGLTDLVRGEFFRIRKQPYILAAQAMGIGKRRIIFIHIMPNAVVATLAAMPFILSGSITSLASLDFLGFGLPPHYPSLGDLVSQGRTNLHAPWIGGAAFGILSLTLILLVFIGEGVRDALDPAVGSTAIAKRAEGQNTCNATYLEETTGKG